MPKLKSGCHNCSRRRVKCDETRPHCNKCRAQGLECAGYGIEVRFVSGVTYRGKNKGQALPGRKGPKRTPHGSVSIQASGIVWSDVSLTGNTTREQEETVPAAESFHPGPDDYWHNASDTVAVYANTLEQYTDINFGTSIESGFIEEIQEYAATPNEILPDSDHALQLSNYTTSRTCSPSQGLIGMDAGPRELFAHFSEAIAPVMVVFDGKFNGYRDLILPMAVEDDLVKQAVSVVSMYHLARQRGGSEAPADARLQEIIRRLRERTDTFSLSDVSAWATIVVLLTGETVTGGTNLPYLFRLLQHLTDANGASAAGHGGQGSSAIHSFLKEQTLMMTLFAQPLLGEGMGTSTLSAVDNYLGFISNAAIFFPALVPRINALIAIIRRACEIYLTRATVGPPHAATVGALERLRLLCLQIPVHQPGHHALVWAYFVAAAESSTHEHRSFFTQRLTQIHSQTRFHNIPAALTTLQMLWRCQGERRWTEVVAANKPVFII
ncbi:hypothetical protein PV08_11796 [Exophiala spinifera]|uniref:Zn(2)-C6 fungal-type domain-containing protein n=1 Tax=Exophiala spinifera TaxID=91928 RepID=A0A0D2AUA1_9EURO|nr:uncharacterized protein PV08_11796 [Exophiala spinifera]KIW10020.1 hypothetical protein PV08_11796 [Exophiala spinifera]